MYCLIQGVSVKFIPLYDSVNHVIIYAFSEYYRRRSKISDSHLIVRLYVGSRKTDLDKRLTKAGLGHAQCVCILSPTAKPFEVQALGLTSEVARINRVIVKGFFNELFGLYRCAKRIKSFLNISNLRGFVLSPDLGDAKKLRANLLEVLGSKDGFPEGFEIIRSYKNGYMSDIVGFFNQKFFSAEIGLHDLEHHVSKNIGMIDLAFGIGNKISRIVCNNFKRFIFYVDILDQEKNVNVSDQIKKIIEEKVSDFINRHIKGSKNKNLEIL